MKNLLNIFIITSFAGLSTTLGFFIIFIKGDYKKIVSFFLSFASGVMFIISLIDLIPTSFNYLNNYFLLFRLLFISFFILLGFLICYLFENILNNNHYNSLGKLGILSFISIILHNIPEGIITFITLQSNVELGLSMALAIALHNIPEGISIAIPLYYAKFSKLKIFFVVFFAGLSELFGALITYLFLINIINDFFMGIILSLVSGIMLNISLFSLLKEGFTYHKMICILGFILGILFMFLMH